MRKITRFTYILNGVTYGGTFPEHLSRESIRAQLLMQRRVALHSKAIGNIQYSYTRNV